MSISSEETSGTEIGPLQGWRIGGLLVASGKDGMCQRSWDTVVVEFWTGGILSRDPISCSRGLGGRVPFNWFPHSP